MYFLQYIYFFSLLLLKTVYVLYVYVSSLDEPRALGTKCKDQICFNFKKNKGVVKGANIMNYLYTNLETTLNIILDVTVNGWITLVTSHSHTH